MIQLILRSLVPEHHQRKVINTYNFLFSSYIHSKNDLKSIPWTLISFSCHTVKNFTPLSWQKTKNVFAAVKYLAQGKKCLLLSETLLFVSAFNLPKRGVTALKVSAYAIKTFVYMKEFRDSLKKKQGWKAALYNWGETLPKALLNAEKVTNAANPNIRPLVFEALTNLAIVRLRKAF